MIKLLDWHIFRNFFVIVTALAAMGITGCTGPKYMQVVNPDAMNATINQDESVIVFFRPNSFVGRALNPGLIEVDEKDNLGFVSIMSNNTKYFHRTTPGNHLYFWSSASILGSVVSYILEANLEAGKIYYVKVFTDHSFTPVTDISDESFIKDFKSCSWVENTQQGQIWFANNITSLQSKYDLVSVVQEDETPKVKVGTAEIDMVVKPEYGTLTLIQ